MKEKRLFVIMNHKLTPGQQKELYRMGVSEILAMDEKLQTIWGTIDPGYDIIKEKEHLQPIIKWLSKLGKPGDYVLIQGEYGASFYLTDFCLSSGIFIPLRAIAQRNVSTRKKPDGMIEKINIYTGGFVFKEYYRYEQ